MIETLIMGLGLVLVIEGLALALAPSRIEEALAFLSAIGPERRRALGLAALAVGVTVLWGVRVLG
ncbi:DUF2065 domain-containing protein [Sedimentimonas flavescens]|uniref:DUF2065 domain-containing protein n=1 Tax=Sedimentimonas flavescens TaxID=2851012 RepID=A0ABT2ZWS0_9RHOB|nr:DUF2065 domain-containing protein [Sedimentimonas flavescens]MCV2878191.1 DUF2065 domain-containing protein [Sedimentimonas flavescens]